MLTKAKPELKSTTMRNIPFFNYPALYLREREEYLRVIDDVCSRGAYILQKDVSEFEDRICSLIDVKHAVGVANGTDGLIIALRALGIEEGDEVLVPSHTYVASAASIHLTGGVPVLTECGPDHMMDFDHARTLVTDRTKFIMPVQVNFRT